MESKKLNRLPKDFFNKERKTISLKDSLKEIIPVEWIKCENDNALIKNKELNTTKALKN